MMGAWKEIITTRKSVLMVGLAGSICSTNYVQQEFEKNQQVVGQFSSHVFLQSEKSLGQQAVAQLTRLFNIFGINESWYKIFTTKDAKGPYFSLRALRSLRFSESFRKIIKNLQLTQIPWGQNITKNLPDEFKSSLPSIEEIEVEWRNDD